MATKSLGIKVN